MEQVLSYLKNNEAKFVEQLCDYVRFPSVSAQTEKHGRDMKACGEWLLHHCRGLGLDAGFGRKLRGLKVTSAEVGDYVDRLVRRYAAQRAECERFAHWVLRAAEADLK